MKCRHCGAELHLTFVDLGSAPPSNAYLGPENLTEPESWFPLRVFVCETCWLVQTQDFTQPETLFGADYAYFSSYSPNWLEHSRCYVESAATRFNLSPDSHAVEVAANDGYLLQYFKAKGVPCTGVEPTASTAQAARAKGLDIIEEFFGVGLAERMCADGLAADLMVANNVLAHVPDINDFVAGFTILLKTGGVATFEFPHLERLIVERQFDTIYHEHYSYLSLTAVARIFQSNGLSVFDVEEWPIHGGSLRVFAQRSDRGRFPRAQRVEHLLQREREAGMLKAGYYKGFQAVSDGVKNDFLSFLLDAKSVGKRVAAYGAAAKGNTLLNYAGVRPDLLAFVVDANPAKQDKFMPGSRIPIVAEERLRHEQPDYVVILPWNLKDEIARQLGYVRAWGGQLVTAVPTLKVE